MSTNKELIEGLLLALILILSAGISNELIYYNLNFYSLFNTKGTLLFPILNLHL